MALEMIDRLPDVAFHRHDVADRHAPVVGPGARIELLRVAEHAGDFGHRREQLRLDLRRAAGDDDARVRPFALEAADALPRLAHGFRRHRAGVDHHRIVEAGRGAGGSLPTRRY